MPAVRLLRHDAAGAFHRRRPAARRREKREEANSRDRGRSRAAAGAAGPLALAGPGDARDAARRVGGRGGPACARAMSRSSSFAPLATSTCIPWAEVPGGANDEDLL